jgi:16S rRNA (guanine966-N2)-methyltransferase
MPKKYPNQIQIIGGMWRGRKIPVPDVPGLRPTPARIRETLFNWLAPFIVDARCLDLFAGSGALGIEALSRGARSATFIDQSPLAAVNIQNYLTRLSVKEISVMQTSIPCATLALAPFDIVFLDPPFQQGLLPPTCLWLAKSGLLKPQALIYIETEVSNTPLSLPASWHILRSRHTATISYHLARS